MLNYRKTKSTKPHWSLPVHHVNNSESENNDLEDTCLWQNYWQIFIFGSIPICPRYWDTSCDLKNANWSGDSPLLFKNRNSISIPLALFWLSLFCFFFYEPRAGLSCPPGAGTPLHTAHVWPWAVPLCALTWGTQGSAWSTTLPPPRAAPRTVILLQQHTHQLQTNIKEGCSLLQTQNTGSQKALRGSGNSFLHFTKNTSLGIDKIMKDGWQAAQK